MSEHLSCLLRRCTVTLLLRLTASRCSGWTRLLCGTALESQFRFALNEDAMATEKLAEGIRLFAADQRKLQQLLIER